MGEHIDVLISSGEIEKRTQEIAEKIMLDYEGKDISMVCVLKGGVMFMVDLARLINQNVSIDFMDVSSYGDSMKSSGNIKVNLDLDGDLTGKHILIVEDIVDTGRTLKYLCKYLQDKNPASIKICTLLDKPSQRLVEIDVDYVGFTIPNAFVVGYGLDYSQKFRNLSYIGILSIE